MKNIVVIGGGASGMMAAVAAEWMAWPIDGEIA